MPVISLIKSRNKETLVATCKFLPPVTRLRTCIPTWVGILLPVDSKIIIGPPESLKHEKCQFLRMNHKVSLLTLLEYLNLDASH